MATTYRKRRRRRRFPWWIVCCLLALTLGTVLVYRALGGSFFKHLPGKGVDVPESVKEDLIPVNPWSRPGTDLETIRGVVIHYVGNPGTTAQANRNYFASLATGAEGISASSHFVVGLEGEVIQCVPLTEVAYASNQRNSDTISIEVCHPDETGQFSPETYDAVVELTAWLCRTFQLDPQEDVIRHYDVTGKICPKFYVEQPEAWDTLKADVADAMADLAAR